MSPIIRDLFRFFPSRVIPALVGILAVPVLTNLFSPEEYGLYLLGRTSLSLIASFCISWLISVTIRFHVVYGFDALNRTCRPLLAAAILVECALWTIVLTLFDDGWGTGAYLWIGLAWLVAHGIFEYYAGWLRAASEAMSYGIAVSWQSIAGLVAAIGLFAIGFQSGVTIFLGQALVVAAAVLVLRSFVVRKLAARQAARQAAPRKEMLSDVLRYGLPATLSNVVTAGLSLADRYVIGGMLGAQAVAVYGASYDLAERTIFFANSMLLLASSVTGFRVFEEEGEANAAAFLSELTRIYLLSVPAIAVGLAVLAPHIVANLLPDTYAAGAAVLPMIAAGGLFVGLLHRYSLLLAFHRRTGTAVWCSAGALVVDLSVCMLLVPRYGIMGAAIGTTIAYACWFAFIRIATLKYRSPKFPWVTLLRTAAALAVSAATTYALVGRLPSVGLTLLAAGLITGFAVYAIALVGLGEVSVDELRSVARAVGRRLGRA